MKYMVMECHTGYAVLLDEEGRFWKAADLHYEVGQTVENPLLMKQPQPSGRRRITRLVSSTVAAVAACLFRFRLLPELSPHLFLHLPLHQS